MSKSLVDPMAEARGFPHDIADRRRVPPQLPLLKKAIPPLPGIRTHPESDCVQEAEGEAASGSDSQRQSHRRG